MHIQVKPLTSDISMPARILCTFQQLTSEVVFIMEHGNSKKLTAVTKCGHKSIAMWLLRCAERFLAC